MEPDEKKPDPKYGKNQALFLRLLSDALLSFFVVLKTGEEMETMTAGGWEGVDLTALLQIRSHHHPRPSHRSRSSSSMRLMDADCIRVSPLCGYYLFLICRNVRNERNTQRNVAEPPAAD